MREIKLRIFTENHKTHTKFAVGRSDTLVFQNDSDQTLRVTVDVADALLDTDNPKGVDLFKVEPRQYRRLSINPKHVGGRFKYTATIAGSETEDPIIIIE